MYAYAQYFAKYVILSIVSLDAVYMFAYKVVELNLILNGWLVFIQKFLKISEEKLIITKLLYIKLKSIFIT